jgi:predicted AlkP superfamily phosphohydrolase/phosphomutase
MTKVIVVGFDGATLDIADPMMDEGKLPNLSSIRNQGTSGTLLSTIPPNSSVAWSSFITGMNPGGHGIFYFRERKSDTYYRPFITYNSIRAKSIWRILSDHQKKVGVVNVPLTYPPEEVNGFLVGGLLTPSSASVFTHPPQLHLNLMRALGDYPLDSEAEKIFWKGDELGAFTHMLYCTKKVLDADLYLMDQFDWDFFMTVFRTVDLVQHRAWRVKVPEYRDSHPLENNKFGNIIEVCYELLDEYLGMLMSKAGEDTTVIVMSDHGCGPIEGKFYINKWLIDHGYLKLKTGSSVKAKLMGIGGDQIDEPRKFEGFDRILSAVGRRTLRFLKPQMLSESMDRIYTSMIDWSRTRAFSSFSGGEEIIIINLKGREPEGTVEPGNEYEHLRDELIAGLESLRDPQGRKIVEKAYRREELYQGPYVEFAPDIQFLTRELSILPRGDLFVDELYSKPFDHTPALHRENGILFMKGNGIKEAFTMEGARLEDLAPTIIHMFGIPVPEQMDGKVLLECLTDEFRKSNELRFEKQTPDSLVDRAEQGYTPDEEEEIRKTLQGLGYLS